MWATSVLRVAIGIGMAGWLAGAARAASLVTLEAGSGQVLTLPRAAGSIFVADPKVAEARPASPTSVFVFGLAPGHTSVAALDAAGKSVGAYDLTVLPSGFAARQAAAAIRHALPGDTIGVTPTPQGLSVTGTVTSPEAAERAMATARDEAGPNAVLADRLRLSGQPQVLLRVRIAEMSRTLTRDLGFNWQNLSADLGSFAQIGLATQFPLNDLSTGAAAPSVLTGALRKTGVEAILDALAQDQLVHILAEPNLTAISGETASFLVGGEFPIPVSQQQGTISVEFKQYGISLAFVPTVLNDGRINLRVRPEVSQLTDQGAVQLTAGNSAIVIPGLQVRRAETTIELGSGQSFAIAGLLSDNTTQTGSGTPFLGDTPILGALFRSDSFKRQQTELVIIVTPYIVAPVSDPAALRAPGESWRPPNDIERLLLLRQSGRAGGPVHVPGDAGFIVQ